MIGGFKKTSEAIRTLLDGETWSQSITISRKNAVHVETQKAITAQCYVTPISLNSAEDGTRRNPVSGNWDVGVWVIEKLAFTDEAGKLAREDELMQVVDEMVDFLSTTKEITIDGDRYPMVIYTDEPRTPVASAEMLEAGLFAGYFLVRIREL